MLQLYLTTTTDSTSSNNSYLMAVSGTTARRNSPPSSAAPLQRLFISVPNQHNTSTKEEPLPAKGDVTMVEINTKSGKGLGSCSAGKFVLYFVYLSILAACAAVGKVNEAEIPVGRLFFILLLLGLSRSVFRYGLAFLLASQTSPKSILNHVCRITPL
mmetsp:Transcript_35999/g.73065  ORF Transcript_35999/g.73065 Transcript_35999/m.73065 type:complete len:158 (+) Transcript_35999:283-756(+)